MAMTEKMFSPEYREWKNAEQLTKRFNEGDFDYLPNRDKEKVAMIAAQYGTNFDPVKGGKPVKKALFDFVDMAAFGMVPDKWRPTSIGEEWHGESTQDRRASAIGSTLGFALGGPGHLLKYGIKGGKAARAWWNRPKIGTVPTRTSGNNLMQLNRGRDKTLLTSGQPRLGAGAPRLGAGNRLGSGSMNMSPRTYQDYLDNF